VDDDAGEVRPVCTVELVLGWDAGAAGELSGGLVRGLAFADPPPPPATVFTVTAKRTTNKASEPSSMRRRRQYTDGCWGPTG
jgi:hypothetical protein